MPYEHPLPTQAALEERRETVAANAIQLDIELNCMPWWRWRQRRDLKREASYLTGLGEGLRLGSYVRRSP